ncbi:hypothetical protein [Luteolibacter sp. Populi]|uniref:hypothetical protein n=1 Tax=Luteolibacter sp. Populi TaxID=3230487 RepID=UPI00346520DB
MLAYFVRPEIAWAILPIAAFWSWVCWRRDRKEKRLLQEALEESFAGFDGAMPRIKKETSYGYPAITLHFQSEEEMNRAADTGRTKVFKARLVEMYGGGGFDIEKAFNATYTGWEAELTECVDNGPDGMRRWGEKKEAERARVDRGGR